SSTSCWWLPQSSWSHRSSTSATSVPEPPSRSWARAGTGRASSRPRRHEGCADGKEEPDALDDHRRPARPLAARPDRRYRGGFHSPAARACPDRAGLPAVEWTYYGLTYAASA